jgi:endo-1,4-beta-xylanase
MNTKTRIQKIQLFFLLAVIIGLAACNQPQSQKEQASTPTLQKAYEGKFYIGAALNTPQIEGTDTASLAVVKQHINSIVAENCMKNEVIHPKQNQYNFELSDKFVAFGEQNHMFIVGHNLAWHSQMAPWFFVDNQGNKVSRDTLINRLKDHIYTVVGRYKGRVNGWDVVNEALDDRDGIRKSPWTEIIGNDFIELAFQFAHEADPAAELYYNDYNLYDARKRSECVKLIQNLKQKGIQIDAVGEQGHYGLGSPDIKEVEASIVAFSELGVKIMITELDITVLPFPSGSLSADVTLSYRNDPAYNPYPMGLPDSVQMQLTQRYADLFGLFIKHSDKITRVTFWGVNDAATWRNDWPINGRRDYPLIFDRNNQPKPAVAELLNLVK